MHPGSSRTVTALALAAAVAAGPGCEELQRVADRVEIACQRARPVARYASLIPGIPASVAAYVIAGCDTAEGLAKLRQDPDSPLWLAQQTDELKQMILADAG